MGSSVLFLPQSNLDCYCKARSRSSDVSYNFVVDYVVFHGLSCGCHVVVEIPGSTVEASYGPISEYKAIQAIYNGTG